MISFKILTIHISMFLSSQPYYFPDNAAYAIGDEDDSGFYVMQTHYNNPGHKHGKLQVHYIEDLT